ncbi:MAG: glycoside hydrolase family 28 protein [Opitutaceae bacterium]|jgi:polygalacturonase
MTLFPARASISCSFILALTAAFARGQAFPSADPGQVYNVRAFGATGDGKTLDTDAINRAIEAAAAAGGGTVRIPAGNYLSFSIRLKSHITLHLDPGCVVIAAAEAPGFGAYDPAEPNEWGDKFDYQNFGHSHFHNSLIWGDGLEDIAITGPGLINGKNLPRQNGDAGLGSGPGRARGGDFAGLPPLPKAAPPPPSAGFSARGRGGNKSIALVNCRNVILRDFSVLQGGWFALLATGVDNLTVDNLKVDTNRDGFNFDSCRNVRVSNCTVNAINDDGICLKSSYALGTPRACENITITGCQVSGYDTGSLLDGTFKQTQEHAVDRDGPTGRIKFGTESNGGFKNIAISNCVFDRCRGLALETVDGGTIEDITITNIAMRNICNSPIFIRLGSRARGPEGTSVGAIRRVTISHVVASDVDARFPILIAGVPGHPVEDVHLSDIRVQYRGGLSLDDAAKQPAAIVNTFFIRGPGLSGPRDPFSPPEQEKAYPEPSMFGLLPAYGVYARHAKDLSLRDVDLSFAKDDTRPAIVLDDVAGAELDHVAGERAGGAPTIVLRKVSDFSVAGSSGVPDRTLPRAEQESL